MNESDYRYHVSDFASKALTRERRQQEETSEGVDSDAVLDRVKQLVENSGLTEDPSAVEAILEHGDYTPDDAEGAGEEEVAFQTMVNDVCRRIERETSVETRLPFQ